MSRQRVLSKFFFLAALLSVGVNTAHAQVLPGPADPARKEQQFEKFRVPEKVEDGVITIPKLPDLAIPENADQIKFVLKEARVTGVEGVDYNEIAVYYTPYLNYEISLEKLYKIAEDITQHYRESGYLLSKAFIPPQTIDGGIVEIKVVEGYIGEITFESEVVGTKPTKRMQRIADKIKAFRPIHVSHLDRYIMLLNDLPGVSVRSILRPVEDPEEAGEGASQLLLVPSKTKFQHSASFDNTGSRFSGPYQFGIRTGFNNKFSRHMETIINSFVPTELSELQFIQAIQRVPINSEGTVVDFQASFSNAEPGFSLKSSDIKSNSLSFSLGVFHPIIRSRKQNFSLSGELSVKNSESDILGTILSKDRSRAVRLTLNYDLNDQYEGTSFMNMTFSKGVDILGARETGSTLLSRANGHSDFTKVSAYAARLQRLRDTVDMLVAVNGQYSATQLLSSEEFGVGGTQFGRAYDSSEITGVHGASGSIEVRYNSPKFNKEKWQMQPFLYYDIGKVWHIDDSLTDISLASTGGGFRFNAGKRFSGSLTVAQPLTKTVDSPIYGNGRSPRYLITSSLRF